MQVSTAINATEITDQIKSLSISTPAAASNKENSKISESIVLQNVIKVNPGVSKINKETFNPSNNREFGSDITNAASSEKLQQPVPSTAPSGNEKRLTLKGTTEDRNQVIDISTKQSSTMRGSLKQPQTMRWSEFNTSKLTLVQDKSHESNKQPDTNQNLT